MIKLYKISQVLREKLEARQMDALRLRQEEEDKRRAVREASTYGRAPGIDYPDRGTISRPRHLSDASCQTYDTPYTNGHMTASMKEKSSPMQPQLREKNASFTLSSGRRRSSSASEPDIHQQEQEAQGAEVIRNLKVMKLGASHLQRALQPHVYWAIDALH